jgi:type II secretory ATPase GspE/PulE/Tfp pilus assembly ATPase PilB-like protein
MLHGEAIVMRLLDKGRMQFSLEKLGMRARSERISTN